MNRGKRKQTELLLLASSLEVLKTASDYEADAVYIDGEVFGFRTNAKNPNSEEMAEGPYLAHEGGKRVYATANIFVYDDDLNEIEWYLQELTELKPDTIIISDPAPSTSAKRSCPGTELHMSTQANNTNYGISLFWWKFGVSRVVTTRELSFTGTREIRGHTPAEMEIEISVHGVMCTPYFGRCLLSSFMMGRDANHDECIHPYRQQCSVTEEKRPGESMPASENERGIFPSNLKDLCMMGHVPELIESGTDSFKIEGRTKTAFYVAVIVRVYRHAIDGYLESLERCVTNPGSYREEIGRCTYREHAMGFFSGRPNEEAQIYDSNTYVRNYIYLRKIAAVDAKGFVRFEQENKLSVGDRVERTCFDGSDEPLVVLETRNHEGLPAESAPHPGEAPAVRFSAIPAIGELFRTETAK